MTIKDNSTIRVAGLGEVLWDVFPDARHLGGAPANFAAHAAALGAQSFVIGSVGIDSLGDEAITTLRRQGIWTDLLSRNDWPTGTVNIDRVNDEPCYEIKTNTAWDNCDWNSELQSYAKTLDAVCFGTLFQRSPVNRETTTRFLNALDDACLKVFDVNLRQDYFSDQIIVDSLQNANALKLNEHELPIVAAAAGVPSKVDDFIECIISDYDLSFILLTAGRGGSYAATRHERSFCDAVPCKVVSTVGAGDAFTAAFVLGHLCDQPLTQSHSEASKLASNVCESAGAMPDVSG